jgi:hypothetical protein
MQAMTFKRIRAAILASALVLGLLIAGCAATGNTGRTGTVKSQSYGDDGYLGMTNAHPKIPGRHMALNYTNDASMMQQSISNLRGLAGSNIVFSGADAYVTIKLKPGLSAQEIPTIEREAASVLRFNFPRYNVHVTSMKL